MLKNFLTILILAAGAFVLWFMSVALPLPPEMKYLICAGVVISVLFRVHEIRR